jgi:hypothetical protein
MLPALSSLHVLHPASHLIRGISAPGMGVALLVPNEIKACEAGALHGLEQNPEAFDVSI